MLKQPEHGAFGRRQTLGPNDVGSHVEDLARQRDLDRANGRTGVAAHTQRLRPSRGF
jgi:hypothetical protein